MKKLFYLFIATTLLISCESNEDDSSNPTTDPFIGEWQLSSYKEDGEEVSDSCERKTTLTVLENGTWQQTGYETNTTTGNCDSFSGEGTWSNKGNSIYLLNEGTESEGQQSFTFSNNNNTFTINEDGDITTFERQ